MKKNKKASILIYILVLISIIMVLSIIVLNNSVMLDNSLNYQTIKSNLSTKIKEKWNIFTSHDISLNNDWSWFIDNISCPKKFTMSWQLILSNYVETNRYYSWSNFHVCSWSYNWLQLNIYPNSNNTSFTWITWWIYTLSLSDFVTELRWVWTIPIDTATSVTIPKTTYQKPDWLDDDFNSDNYIWG